MGIIINWRNRNTVTLEGINIYRTSLRGDTPVLIDQVAGDVTTYDDVTALTNTLYFYQTGSVYNGYETKSLVFPAMRFTDDDSGPGPQTFMRGNHAFGLMGSVDLALLPTYDEIAIASSVGRGGGVSNVVSLLKWCVNGRIIYTPDTFYNNAITPANLKSLLVKPNTPGTYFSLVKGDYTFKIRPPYGTTQRDVLVEPGVPFLLDYTDDVMTSEMGALLRTMQRPVTPKIGEPYCDQPELVGGLWSNTYKDNSNIWMFYCDGNTQPIAASVSTAPFIPIYELLFD